MPPGTVTTRMVISSALLCIVIEGLTFVATFDMEMVENIVTSGSKIDSITLFSYQSSNFIADSDPLQQAA